MRTFELDGARIADITSFYAEINRVLMDDEDWELGASLDALDDLLYGGYGATQGTDPARVVWHASEHSRAALGVDATRAWYEHKLAHPETYGSATATAALEELERDGAPTYFDLVVAVFAGHERVELVLR